jgi:hypothetical protein
MPKGALLTDDVKILIAKVYKKYSKKWTAPMVRNEVDLRLHNQKFTGWPSLSSVQKVLAIIRKKESEPSPLDETWCFYSLAEYPIAPEAIPLVISIYNKCYLESEGSYTGAWMPSIREMLWVGRLHKIIEIYHSKCIRRIQGWTEEEREKYRLRIGYPPQWYQQIKLEDVILNWAYRYSENEIVKEDLGWTHDPRNFDSFIMSNPFDDYDYRRNAYIERIAEYYGIDEDKLRDPNLSIGDIEQIAGEGGKK